MPTSSHFTSRTRLFTALVTALIPLLLAAYYVWSLPPATAAATDLFFSEYIEGSSNNKALEIYNATGAPVNLLAAGYNVQMFFNGNPTAGLTINLTGTVADGDVYVLAQSAASAAILAQADQTNGAGWFNGDDAVVLRKGTTVIDVLGQIGSDPGTEWGSGLTSTADNTLRRKSSICGGDTNGTDSFDPAIEWDGFATDTFDGLGSHSGCGGLTLSINNVTQAELDGGTSTFTFTVSLSANAPPSGVTFDIATADGTTNPATAGSDYVAKSEIGRTISAGNNSATFTVTVNGDTSVEPDETFFVNVTNVSNATVADGQGLGTITNDDVVIIPINQIQGSGTTSTLVGQNVTTTGVVTGRRSNGFFLQTPDGAIDGNSETSEGILVFTGAAPPSAATIGNFVQVSGTVTEFIPGPDPNSQPETELTSPTVTFLSPGTLPAPVVLTPSETTDPSEIPGEPLDTLEEYEGMRVTVASLTVSAPTQAAFIDENDAFAVSNGVFYGVITGVARPFREEGINVSDPVPAPNPPNVPRFDENPERIRIDSDSQPGTTAINVTSGTIVTNITGPLDYAFRTYTILPDAATPPVVGINAVATPVPLPTGLEFTVASFNTFHFYDTVNDAGVSDVALTPTAYNNRLNKISLVIRNVMRTPDVIGLQEIEKLSVLQDIANKVNADAVAAGDPNPPQYAAYLEEGHDIGGIDVGFLVKSSRVTVVDVTQVEVPDCDPDPPTTCYSYIDPNSGQPALLNDRPPLILRATIQSPTGSTQPFTVIVNHLRSFNGIDDPVDGNRVRTKRRAQAEFLANLIQGRQSVNLSERIIVVGDMNAFQFNDGYVDVIGTIKGTPTPADEVVLPSSDLVNPDLTDLVDTLDPLFTDQQYSYTFDGNAQVLDHIIINQPALALNTRFVYARNNADFPATYYGDSTRPERITDHDIPVAYFTFPPASVDLSITKSDSPDPVVTGSDVTYTINVTNNGPDNATSIVITDNLPPETTFVSCNAGLDGVCGGTGNNRTITYPLILAGQSRSITLVATVNCSVADNQTISNTATVDSTEDDPDTANNSDTETTTASNPAPVITGASANPSVLGPPNHKMVDVTVSYGATDNCGAPTCVLTVTSNEPVNGPNDGNTAPDWEVIDDHHVRLRAERSGSGSGRVYTITITCTDSGGRSSTQTVTVTVPLN